MEEAFPTLPESSDAGVVELGADQKLCHLTEECRQMQALLPIYISAVKIEPRDEQQSSCDSGHPSDFIEVKKEEPFFMEEDMEASTVAADEYFGFPVKAEPVKAEPVKAEPVKAEPIKAEPVKAEPGKAAVAPPSIPQPPANQEPLTTADVFTACQAAPVTACFASTSMEELNCGALMTVPSSANSTTEDKSQTNEMLTSSTYRQASEARPRNNDRLLHTSAAAVNCDVLGNNETKNGLGSCKTEACLSSEDVHSSKYCDFNFNECRVLLTRIHVPENFTCIIEEQNGVVKISSKKMQFSGPDNNHGENSKRTESCGKDSVESPNMKAENALPSYKNIHVYKISTYIKMCHQQTRHNRSKLPCASPKEGISVSNSRGHLAKKKKTFKCCGFAFRHKSNYDQHVSAVHLKLRPYKCPKCDYAAACDGNLQIHLNSVHEKLRQFQCAICDVKFSSKYSLKNHISSAHLKLKPYKCPHCEYSASQKKTLTRHVSSIHLMIKPHKCNLCDYSASIKLYLDTHYASVHTGVKPYQCADCSYAGASKYLLNGHIKRVHLKDKKYKCDLCDFATISKGNLAVHIASVHQELKSYKCNECDYTAATKGRISRSHENEAIQM
ncbi:zinc finger protein 888 isoform X2 [Hyalella azteca]|uniref:Zinc finger protein 888 isoform X2 n=1 Tax=Hyalella azteca TaxID=294128 RepID=A0A979FXR1_HYAAZ|nr:zinc finger protein 888 isoform X2 [Hyalella azteca]